MDHTHARNASSFVFSNVYLFFFMAEAAGSRCINDGLSVRTEAVAASNSDLSAMQ